MRISHTGQLEPPVHVGDAGFDLAITEGALIDPHTMVELPTGVRLALPPDVWVRITGRSSTIRRHGLMVVEGVIDSGFRGELKVGLFNLSNRQKKVEIGMRLAQVIPHTLITPAVELVPLSDETFHQVPSHDKRGSAGFGSTG